MSPDLEQRLEEIFSAARDLPPLERAAFLERSCGGDTELRQEADSLLVAHEQPGQFLQNRRKDISAKATATARLHVVLAREAPLAVVIRRGPAKQVCTVLWNRRTDEFTLGQWLRGRIYEDRCDDGGIFTGARSYWLDPDHRCVQETAEIRRDPAADYPQIWHARWAEAGWRFHCELDATGIEQGFREKNLPRAWILRLRLAQAYELEHPSSGRLKQFSGWEWSELDQNRLVWAEKGCLFAAALDREAGVGSPTLLRDFNAMKFEARAAPY